MITVSDIFFFFFFPFGFFTFPLLQNVGWVAGGIWSKPLHFINTVGDTFIPSRDCVNDQCVYGSILNYTKRLSRHNPPCVGVVNPTPSYNPEPCPLEFLTHFVGDIHQPLHCTKASLYPRGGNEIPVNVTFVKESPSGIATNIHAVWDKYMIEEYIQRKYYGEVNAWMQWGDDMVKQLTADERRLFKEYGDETDLFVVSDYFL